MQETVSQGVKSMRARGKEKERSVEASDDDEANATVRKTTKSASGAPRTIPSTSHSSRPLTHCVGAQISTKTYSKDKVRTDGRDRTLDSMFPILANASSSSSPSTGRPGSGVAQTPTHAAAESGNATKYRNGNKAITATEPAQIASSSSTVQPTLTQIHARPSRTREIKESECYLSSVKRLREAVVSSKQKHNRELCHLRIS